MKRLFNRPCVAGAVLQTPLSLIHSFIYSLAQSVILSPQNKLQVTFLYLDKVVKLIGEGSVINQALPRLVLEQPRLHRVCSLLFSVSDLFPSLALRRRQLQD